MTCFQQLAAARRGLRPSPPAAEPYGPGARLCDACHRRAATIELQACWQCAPCFSDLAGYVTSLGAAFERQGREA